MNTIRKIGNANRRTSKFIVAAAIIAAVGLALWIAPVTYGGGGTVAAATGQIDCATAVWPNIPGECMKNADAADRRIIVIPESRQG